MAVDFASGARVNVPFLGVAKAKEVPDALSKRGLAVVSTVTRRLAQSVAASYWSARLKMRTRSVSGVLYGRTNTGG